MSRRSQKDLEAADLAACADALEKVFDAAETSPPRPVEAQASTGRVIRPEVPAGARRGLAAANRICWFDFETGGLAPTSPDIQIAAIATDGFEEIETFEAKIRFDESKADPEALKLNHYDAGTWKREAKPEPIVVEEFGAFLRRHSTVEMVSKRTGAPYQIARLAGHNSVGFDAPRLIALFKRHGQFLPAEAFRPLDTMQLALWFSVGTGHAFKSFRLSDLCSDLGIETVGAHDALADVRMCLRLARALTEAAHG